MIIPIVVQPIGLKNIDVLITDVTSQSEYFQISNLPDIIPVGKTAFGIDPPPELLKTSSEVKVELIDVNGNAIFVEALNDPDSNLFSEGFTDPNSTARLITITVYPDTPYGYADLIIVGEALFITDANGNKIPIPTEWKGIYNVKWTKKVLIDPNRANDSRVLFFRTPYITFSEIQQTYLSQVYSGAITASVSTAVSASYLLSYDASDDNTTLHANGFTFTKDMLGGTINIPTPSVPSYISNVLNGTLGAFNTYISHLWNETTAEVRDVYTASAIVSGKVRYINALDVLSSLRVPHFDPSAFTLTYNTIPTYSTSPNFKSFAKIDINDLTTISGDVYRIKVFQKSAGSISDWKLITEKVLEDMELLFSASADPSAQYMGIFSGQASFDLHWKSSSFDFSTGLFASSSNPTVTFDSIVIFDGLNAISPANTNGMIVNFIYPNMQFAFKKGQNLQVSFKLASNSSIGTLDVYASGSAFNPSVKSIQTTLPGTIESSVIFDTASLKRQDYSDILGKILTSYSDKSDSLFGITRNANYGTITIPFQVDQDGSGSILFAMRSGSWTISDVSLVYPQETGFNPDAVSLLIPMITEQENDNINFLVRFYDITGKEITIPPPPPGTTGKGNTFSISFGSGVSEYDKNQGTIGNFPQGIPGTIPFLGPSHYIDGTRNVLSGSLWVASDVAYYRTGLGTVGSGIEISANAAPGPGGVIGHGSIIRSLGYEGWVSASSYNRPGFMIWSGSILPGSGDAYDGIGIELWGSGSTGIHSLRFRTDTGILEITGSINATTGFIGGWKVLATELVSSPDANLSLSGSGAGYIVARDKDLVDRLFFGITPDAATASDGFRDYTKYRGIELLYNGNFEIPTPPSEASWSLQSPYVTASLVTDLGAGSYYALIFSSSASGLASFSASYNTPNGITWKIPSIGEVYTLTFKARHTNISYWNPYYGNIIWYQFSGSNFENLKTDLFYMRPVKYPPPITGFQEFDFSFQCTSVSTGSIYFTIYGITTHEDELWLSDFSLTTYSNFVDISTRGLYIFGTPSSYIKLGAEGISQIAITSISASNITVAGTASISNLSVFQEFSFTGQDVSGSASFGLGYVLTDIDGSGSGAWLPATGGGGGGTPGGADTDIQINSAGKFYGNANFTFDLSSSIAQLTGSMLITGSLIVTGDTLVSGALHISSSFTADASASIGKSTPINAVFDVNGNAIISGTLETTNTFSADKSASIGKSTPINAVFDVNGDAIVSGSLTVTGTWIGGTINIFNYVNFQ